jgi:hypothetical protein
MPDGKRLWRTEKGDLVEDGHPEAQVLAYGVDDALADEDTAKVRKGHTPKSEATVTPKKRAPATPKK